MAIQSPGSDDTWKHGRSTASLGEKPKLHSNPLSARLERWAESGRPVTPKFILIRFFKNIILFMFLSFKEGEKGWQMASSRPEESNRDRVLFFFSCPQQPGKNTVFWMRLLCEL